MAFGTHWEWRGFGAVSSRFASRFCALAPQREVHYIEDLYLWIPGLDVNVKLRKGAEEGLKFKRKIGADGRLDLWSESPQDVFAFPLGKGAWELLSRTTRTADLNLPPYAATSAGREQVLTILEERGCKLVPVQKWREGRLWRGTTGPVIVEWTCILGPQLMTTIGIESQLDNQGIEGQASRQASEDIREAIQELGLADEPLIAMNFMTAVAVWAAGRQITP
jgi:hypothetical protein